MSAKAVTARSALYEQARQHLGWSPHRIRTERPIDIKRAVQAAQEKHAPPPPPSPAPPDSPREEEKKHPPETVVQPSSGFMDLWCPVEEKKPEPPLLTPALDAPAVQLPAFAQSCCTIHNEMLARKQTLEKMQQQTPQNEKEEHQLLASNIQHCDETIQEKKEEIQSTVRQIRASIVRKQKLLEATRVDPTSAQKKLRASIEARMQHLESIVKMLQTLTK